ncbi:MAG: hypothetical protein J6M10_10365 [Clostridia bacterium]|nr:hypothetical protein [Clostridia bacterium]
MTRENYEFLERLASQEIRDFCSLSAEDRERFHLLERMEYIQSFFGGSFNVLPAGLDALAEYRRNAADREAALLHESRVLQAQERAAVGVKELAAKLVDVQGELEQSRKEFADFKRQQAEQYAADMAQAKLDLKKLHRHDILVALFSAAFTAAFTLIAQNLGNILNFLKSGYEFVIALFK